MKYFKLGIAIALFTLTGCAHSTMRGSVAMKVSDSEAHVCMGEKEVNSGDKLVLFKNVCEARTFSKGGSFRTCKKVKIGVGVVERTLNEHYSLVKVEPGVEFEEGTIIEKD